MRVLLSFLFAILIFTGPAAAAPIHDAAKKGDVAALEAVLAAGADVNESDGFGTPLYYAARRGHLAAAKLLIERGADVNASAKFGPALVAAAAKGKIELMTLLLENGANPDAQFEGQAALHISVKLGCLDCVKALVAAGAKVNAQTKDGKTPIHLAKFLGLRDMAGYLMAHGVVLPKPAPISAKLAGADAEKGRIVFNGGVFNGGCSDCHFVEPEKGRKFGPNLWGVVGRDKASLMEAGYSDALRAWEGVWTYEDLNIFLSGPMVTTPGVIMESPGVEDEAERVNLIAYLRVLSDSPMPLP